MMLVFMDCEWSGYREKEDIKRLLEIFERRNCPIFTLHTSGHADN